MMSVHCRRNFFGMLANAALAAADPRMPPPTQATNLSKHNRGPPLEDPRLLERS